MRFDKMEGLGNDFLVVDDRRTLRLDWGSVTPGLCDRHRGVGADGVLLIGSSRSYDLRMRLFNADGSEAEMCGNGIRCTALWAVREGAGGERIVWETGAGPVTTRLDDGGVAVELAAPRFGPGEVPVALGGPEVLDVPLAVGGETVRVSCVGLGNPHCVAVVDELDSAPLARLGPLIEHHPCFPRRTNVEFVQVVSRTTVALRTWERGVGETDACGTGACAAQVILRRLGLVDAEVTVRLRGGELRIVWAGSGPVTMCGPARWVFRGDVDVPVGGALTAAGATG